MLRRAFRGAEQGVRDILALCCVDPSRVGRDVFEAHVELARERALHGRVNSRDFLAAQRSLMVRLLRRRRFYAMVATIRASGLIVQGKRDRLVRIEATRVSGERDVVVYAFSVRDGGRELVSGRVTAVLDAAAPIRHSGVMAKPCFAWTAGTHASIRNGHSEARSLSEA